MQVRTFIKPGIALCACVLGTAAAHAQTDPGSIERTVPRIEISPGREVQPTIAAPTAPHAGAGITQTFVLSAVAIDGATVFSSEELAPAFEPYLASRVGQAELDKIVSAITDRYRESGFLLSYAVLPEQSVQSGIVRVHVVEGFVGKVRLEGDRRAAKALSRLFGQLAAERPLRGASLERTIGLGRDVPGVVISDVRISRSPQDPANHLLTIAVGADRVRAIAYADNRGTIEGARLRAYSSFSLASLAVPGDQVQVDLFAIPSEKFRYAYAQAKWSVPLGSDGLRFAAAASYGDQFQRVPGPNQDGMSRQLTGELSYPFVKTRAFSMSGHVLLGDLKSVQHQSGATLQRDRIQVARAWLEFARVARIRIDGKIGVSQGLDWDSATDRGDPLASRPFASAEFTKFNAGLQLAAALSDRLSLRFDSAAQVSTKPLLAPEEFALGGSRIGRAFDFNDVTGDHGLGAMLELGYRVADTKQLPSNLEIFTFIDGGGAFRDHSSLGLPKQQWLASAGAGARFSALGFYWSGEVGIPVARSDADRNVRAFFSTTKMF